MRLRALDCSKTDIQQFVQKYMMSAVESGETSRVVFGAQADEERLNDFVSDGWSVYEPMDFLSSKMFEKENKID